MTGSSTAFTSTAYQLSQTSIKNIRISIRSLSLRSPTSLACLASGRPSRVLSALSLLSTLSGSRACVPLGSEVPQGAPSSCTLFGRMTNTCSHSQRALSSPTANVSAATVRPCSMAVPTQSCTHILILPSPPQILTLASCSHATSSPPAHEPACHSTHSTPWRERGEGAPRGLTASSPLQRPLPLRLPGPRVHAVRRDSVHVRVALHRSVHGPGVAAPHRYDEGHAGGQSRAAHQVVAAQQAAARQGQPPKAAGSTKSGGSVGREEGTGWVKAGVGRGE